MRTYTSHDSGADAAALGIRYVDVTCTSATTRSMTQLEQILLGTNPSQFSSLAADDSVVMLTNGATTGGFTGVLETSVTLSLTDLFGHPFQRHYTAGGTDRLAATVSATAPKVTAALRSIHAWAPLAGCTLRPYLCSTPTANRGIL